MAYDRGERAKFVNSISTRDKRRMIAQLAAAAEAEETAREAKEKLMAELWGKGLTQSAISGATGISPDTVRKIFVAQGLDVDPK